MPDLVRTIPTEEYFDAVNKARVSTPQSLIDTDFEYGLQPTKWEFLNIVNNRPTCFYTPSVSVAVSNIAGNGSSFITVTANPTPAIGTPVYLQDTTNQAINGWWIVDTTSYSTNVSFTVYVSQVVSAGGIYDANKTYVFAGSFYSGAGIPVATGSGAAFTTGSTTVTVTTVYAHGLAVGDWVYVVGTTAATSGPPNGTWQVVTTPTANSATITIATASTGAITAAGGATATLYIRPTGISNHRSFDGGVQFSNGGSPNGSLVRQTRRYFRYQSGKGIQFSTGTTFKPALMIDTLTATGQTVTLITKYPHYAAVGSNITVSGATQANYNGTYAVATVPSPTSLTYNVPGNPTWVSPATGFPIIVSPQNWYGTSNRVGLFDQQNGTFYEYDGQTTSVVRRNSTTQISGTLAIANGNNTVTGTNTQFVDQLAIGDYVVIRGMSYRVWSILSQTSMLVYPEYRGGTVAAAIGSKTIDSKIPQSQWNLDKMDGTGSSGYNLDLTKMQMVVMDYTWYGAGFIRWGFRDVQGNIKYANKSVNNNINTLAYMRSGNLPARYETINIPPQTTITASIASGDLSIAVVDTTAFPPTGTIRVRATGQNGTIEYITYTSKTATSFAGLTRGATGGSAATAFTYSATAPISVEYASNMSAPALMHWGSAVTMDGRYDNDLSFQFTAAHAAPIANVASNVTVALIAIRLAPSVDSGFTGVLGAKEIINRMQLKMLNLSILSTGIFRVNGYLNSTVASGTFAAAGGSSLAQTSVYTSNTSPTLAGGESIWSDFTNTAGGTNYTLTTYDLTTVRDMGTSILSGGTNNNVPTSTANLYPDGPDVFIITATNISGVNANIAAKLSWTEAQA
jgi:hypothetical protein